MKRSCGVVSQRQQKTFVSRTSGATQEAKEKEDVSSGESSSSSSESDGSEEDVAVIEQQQEEEEVPKPKTQTKRQQLPSSSSSPSPTPSSAKQPDLKRRCTPANAVPRVLHTPYDLSELKRPIDMTYVQQLEVAQVPLKMMVMDVECVNRWNMPKYTHVEATKCPEKQHSVPVYKLHGVTENGMSAVVNVYGFFPFIYLHCAPAVDGYMLMEFAEAIEKELSQVDHLYCPRMPDWKIMKRVLRAEVEDVFPANDYHEQPIKMVKLTLALPQYCTYLGKLFFTSQPQLGRPTVSLPTYGDVEIQPYNCLDASTQFLMESELVGCGWISCTHYQLANEGTYSDRSRADVEALVYYGDVRVIPESECNVIAPLRIVTFDIECGNTGGFPDAQHDPIISISLHLSDKDGNTVKEILLQHGDADEAGNGVLHIRFYGSNKQVKDVDIERELLRTFGQIVNTIWDTDIIVGHNSKSFDLPYVVERAHALEVPEAECLSRTKSRWRPPRTVVRTRKNGDTRNSKEVVMIGRVQLDTMVIIQADSFKKERSYGLAALSQKYLGATKDDVGYKLITPLWRTSNMTRRRLGVYNMKDSQLTFGLFKKFGMLYDVIETCKVTRIMPNTLVNSGQQVKVWAQLLHESKSPGWEPNPKLRAVIPFEVPVEIAKDDKCGGATVLEPKRGFHNRPVAVADYASLYPSIMISKNICYSTLVRNKSHIQRLQAEDKCRTSPTNSTFVKQDVREGLVSKMLKKLIAARAKAKQQLAEATSPIDKMKANSKQNALKVASNSTYGFMNASGGKLRRMCMAESVTSWGREFIAIAKDTAEQEFGVNVIYGDTDSIMMIKDGVMDREKMFDILRQVCKRVTEKIGMFPVQLQAEKVYHPYLLLKKKHYAGMMYMSPTECKGIDMKGIETARRDYCPYVSETLTEMLKILLKEGRHENALKFLQDSIAALYLHKVEIHKLVCTRSLSKAVYKNKQAHSELAKRMEQRDKNFKMNQGERIPFLIVDFPGKKLISDKAETPMEVIEKNIPIDYDYYAKHQLKEPSIRLLQEVLIPEDPNTPLEERMPEKQKGKLAAKIIYDEEIFRRIPKILPKISTDGLGRFFKKKQLCRCCGSDNVVMCLSEYKGLYCSTCVSSGLVEKDQTKLKEQIKDMEDSYLQMRKKCAECRGYDEESPCVQIDCAYSFKKAVCLRETKALKAQVLSE